MIGLAARQGFSIDVPRVNQVLVRQQVLARQGLMDEGEMVPIGRRGRGRLPVNDEVRRVGIASLGEVRLVADPGGAALVGVARVHVVGS